MAARGAPSRWRWALKPTPMPMFRACCWRQAKDIRAMLASDVSDARHRFEAIGSTERHTENSIPPNFRHIGATQKMD
jgi:hypothetical protein